MRSRLTELSLFTGAGGGLLGTLLLGFQPIGYVEFNDYCQKVIAARIKDGILPVAPIFGDIRSFISSGSAKLYRGVTDIITGGFPCQPFSVAGRQVGADDERNMWPYTIECIRMVRPRYAFLENVPGLLSSGYFGTILRDLAQSGYHARWRVLSAAELGAPHQRDRLWIVADTNIEGLAQRYGRTKTRWTRTAINGRDWWTVEPAVDRMAHGLASRVDRLKAIGNGQVPAVAAAAWQLLLGGGLGHD